MDWDLCRTFLHIARTGSLSAAARVLGMTHPTARRHLEELEQFFGARLFTRSTHGLVATELARRVMPEAEAMEASFEAMIRLAREKAGAVEGTLRLSVSEVMGTQVMPAMLTRIMARHPGIRFELCLSDAETDILRRDADIAVRMLRPHQASLVARKVGAIELGFFAHRSWLAGREEPKTLSHLLASPVLIGQDRRHTLAHALGMTNTALRPSQILAADNDVAQLAALRAGMGVGIMQVPLAAREPELLRLLPEQSVMMEVWLVTHPDLRSSTLVKAAMQALHEELQAYIRDGAVMVCPAKTSSIS